MSSPKIEQGYHMTTYHNTQEDMSDEVSDRIVHGTAALAVIMMLVGMIGFPLAGMWSTTEVKHDTVQMMDEVAPFLAQREISKNK